MNKHLRTSIELASLLAFVFVYGCAGPAQMVGESRASVRTVVVVSAKNPSRFHFAGDAISFPIAAAMGTQAARQREFDRVFVPFAPDIASPLTDESAQALRASGYDVIVAESEVPADATLILNLRAAGYGTSFNGTALAPQIMIIAQVKRQSDQKILYYEAFAYGGGFSGTITKIQHSESLGFQSADALFSQPQLASDRLVVAARAVGTRVVEQLKR